VSEDKQGQKTWGFKEQLSLGKKGEEMLKQIYHAPPLTTNEGREWDLNRKDGARIEVKTDTYDEDRTENFFFERWSVGRKDGVMLPPAERKPGSVWQSLEKGATVLVYYFVNSNVYYEFSNLYLLKIALEQFIKIEKPREIFVRNRGYDAVGYKVPRRVLQSLYECYRVTAEGTRAKRET
jgi:hypothetical protein